MMEVFDGLCSEFIIVIFFELSPVFGVSPPFAAADEVESAMVCCVSESVECGFCFVITAASGLLASPASLAAESDEDLEVLPSWTADVEEFQVSAPNLVRTIFLISFTAILTSSLMASVASATAALTTSFTAAMDESFLIGATSSFVGCFGACLFSIELSLSSSCFWESSDFFDSITTSSRLEIDSPSSSTLTSDGDPSVFLMVSSFVVLMESSKSAVSFAYCMVALVSPSHIVSDSTTLSYAASSLRSSSISFASSPVVSSSTVRLISSG
mmetsp:Transcript_27808/g.58447  ORF Transcript_27808/g.58447 Transcript_27808/m.58447 type:complete len:271 (+) Transcript_27808:1120-1932(+)